MYDIVIIGVPLERNTIIRKKKWQNIVSIRLQIIFPV